jgi:hypothetical protein
MKTEKTKHWKLAFWTPGHRPDDDGETFGCATNGLWTPIGWKKPTDNAVAIWDPRVPWEVLAGSYQEVLGKLRRITRAPSLAVVVFSRPDDGVAEFLSDYHKIFPNVPLAGGIAARLVEDPEILPLGQDVALLLVSGKNFTCEPINAYKDTGVRVEFEPGERREIRRVRILPDGEWEDAIAFYRRQQAAFAVPTTIFESITFSDESGRNVHCSVATGVLKANADLPENHLLVLRQNDQEGISAEAEVLSGLSDSLYFFCTGLGSMVNRVSKMSAGTMMGFMFGEIGTYEGVPKQGGLMAIRLRKV